MTRPFIRGISRYRGWSVQQTLVWLELRPAQLIAQDLTCDRTSWAEAI